MNRKARRAILVTVSAAFFGLVGLTVARQLGAGRQPEQGRGPVPVAVSSPRRGEIRRVLSYAGTVEPQATVTVTPKVAGRVESIAVREGDRVARGQLLAVMESDVVRLQMEQAQGAWRAAEAQYEKAKKGVRSEELENAEALLAQAEKDVASAEDSYQRLGKLYKEGTISRSRYDDAERQLGAARTQLENARRNVQMMRQGASTEELAMAESQMRAMQAQYDLARLGMDNARVTAPLSGHVVKVHTDQGNMAGQATPLVTIAQDDQVLVRVPVPEKHYGELRQRQDSLEARVTLNALPGRVYAGRVTAIAPTIDPASRTFSVELEVANPSGELKAGMYARVELVVERIDDALLVPAVAVVRRGGRTGVFTVHEGSSEVARFTEVETGLAEGQLVQVTRGLGETDRVVTEGNTFLEDGEEVSPAETAAP